MYREGQRRFRPYRRPTYNLDVPTYEYACQSCGQHVEVYQRFTDPPLSACGICGGTLRKVFHPAGILFKGSGFYSTDSKRTASSNGDAGSAASKGEGASTKPAASTEPSPSSSPASSSPSTTGSKERSA